jgi:hypothetical protein
LPVSETLGQFVSRVADDHIDERRPRRPRRIEPLAAPDHLQEQLLPQVGDILGGQSQRTGNPPRVVAGGRARHADTRFGNLGDLFANVDGGRAPSRKHRSFSSALVMIAR